MNDRSDICVLLRSCGALCTYREELGTLVQKSSYKASMKIISSVQQKIEGWDVRSQYVNCTCTVHEV